MEYVWLELRVYLLMPFSTVSRTKVEDSWIKVLVLAVEKPETADDSEIEERLEWSNGGETPVRRPNIIHNRTTKIHIMCVMYLLIDRLIIMIMTKDDEMGKQIIMSIKFQFQIRFKWFIRVWSKFEVLL